MNFGEWQPRKGYLPALSIKQPWAWLICHNVKDIENREWRTNYRGPLLIHAGKAFDEYGMGVAQQMLPDIEKADYPIGGIVGIATLTDIVMGHSSPWFSGKYGFVLKGAKVLPFVPYSGKLGLFSVPETLLKGDETTLRARNIPYTPPRDLDNAYELTKAIEKAEAAQQPREVPVFGDPLWINRSQTKPVLGRGCVIEINDKRI